MMTQWADAKLVQLAVAVRMRNYSRQTLSIDLFTESVSFIYSFVHKITPVKLSK